MKKRELVPRNLLSQPNKICALWLPPSKFVFLIFLLCFAFLPCSTICNIIIFHLFTLFNLEAQYWRWFFRSLPVLSALFGSLEMSSFCALLTLAKNLKSYFFVNQKDFYCIFCLLLFICISQSILTVPALDISPLRHATITKVFSSNFPFCQHGYFALFPWWLFVKKYLSEKCFIVFFCEVLSQGAFWNSENRVCRFYPFFSFLFSLKNRINVFRKRFQTCLVFHIIFTHSFYHLPAISH